MLFPICFVVRLSIYVLTSTVSYRQTARQLTTIFQPSDAIDNFLQSMCHKYEHCVTFVF